MPIEKIPAIREDYPLFSWDDHAESFAALRQGAEVAGFKKETWNAIIETLQDVLSEGGLSWDKSSYTTAENAKITQAYGELRAAMFNAVRHNIDRPAPVGWRWENDSTFRGYVGRKDFRGYSEYGLQGDLFYAEYLIEIVRKLNLLIEILRGTAPFAEFASAYDIGVKNKGNLLAKPSAPVVGAEIAHSNTKADILPRQSAPMTANIISQTKTDVHIIPLGSKPMVSEDLVQTKTKANAEAVKSAPIKQRDQIIKTIAKGGLKSGKSASMRNADGIISAKSTASLFTGRMKNLSGYGILQTIKRAEAHSLPSVPMGAKSLHHSLELADLKKGKSMPMNASEIVKSSEIAKINMVPPVIISARELIRAKQSATLGKVNSKPIGAAVGLKIMAAAKLDFAWLPPIRTGNNLYIRQVYDMERDGNNLRFI